MLYCQSELSSPWGIDIPEFKGMMVLILVTSGAAWLDICGEDPVLLEPGTVALLPHGIGDETNDEINRLGFFARPPLDAEHVNWINTITVDGASQNAPLNHSHYVNTASVRKDIAMILNGHADDGAERCVFPASQEGFFFISPNCL
jgi:hypothetical protein